MKLSVPVSIAVGGALIAHEVRIARIEETRFTKHDAAVLKNTLVEYHNGHSTPPPKWVQDLLKQIHSDIREINKRLINIETRRDSSDD
jgi:hypothetical protein